MHKRIQNLDGKKFGSLTATNITRKRRNRKLQRLCHCDCGQDSWVETNALISGGTKSCGCKQGGGRKLSFGTASRNEVLRNYKSSAKKRALVWKITDKEFDELTSGICHYCGSPPSRVKHTGRNYGDFVYNGIDSAIGYTVKNVVPCCTLCNRAKNTMNYIDFIHWIDNIRTHNRLEVVYVS